MRLRFGCLATGLMASVASVAQAGLVVDGNLSDWGIVVKDNNQTAYNVPNNIGLVGSMKEDSDDNAGSSGYLGPHSGGQNYDAEFMGIAVQNNRVYISILTGQRPDNGFSSFGPGDLRIMGTQNGVATTWAIEVGGGAGGGSAKSAIVEGASGTTYTLNSSAATTAANVADAAQVAGSIWKGGNWINNPLTPQGPTQFQKTASSVSGGLADYIYTLDSFTKQHAVIELSFALNTPFWANANLTSFFWRPSCGNDELNVYVTGVVGGGGINPVPEPASLALWGLGAIALAPAIRRRRAARA